MQNATADLQIASTLYFLEQKKVQCSQSKYTVPFHVIYDKDRLDLGHCMSQKRCGGLIEIFHSIDRN